MATAEATGGTALVWGATGGIGRAVVERLRVDGWSVGAVGRDTHALPALTPHCYEADLSDAFSVQQAVMAKSAVSHASEGAVAAGSRREDR